MISKLIIMAVFAVGQSMATECPRIDCMEKPREDLLCYKNEGMHPLTKATFYPCPTGMICDIDYTQQHKNFPMRNPDIVWVNSTQQALTTTSNKNLSSLYMRKTEAFCVSKEKYKINLAAGRFCVHNS
jgi:hypothetical protein